MSLVIDDNRMFSLDTPHTATRRGGKWVVSWLPSYGLTRIQAITAMTLAEQVAKDASMCGPDWLNIVRWAGELGLSGQEAVALCQVTP